MQTLLLAPDIDNRDGDNIISSRIGLSAPEISFHTADNLYSLILSIGRKQTVDCIFIDEAQFL